MSNLPSDSANTPRFHGPKIAVIATLAYIVSSPGQTYGISLFVESWMSDLDLSRSELSTLYTLATIGGALSMPSIGRAVDKLGPKAVTLAVSLGLGLALTLVSFATGIVALFVGVFGLRMFGQGAFGMCAGNITARWYNRRRGKIVGITLASASLVTAFYPKVVERLISSLGWRTSLLILAVWVWLMMLPLVKLWMINSPSDVSQEQDGRNVEKTEERQEEGSMTLEQAQRTGVFWALVAAGCTIAFLFTGLAFHQTSILGERGLSAAQSAGVWLPHFIAISIGTLWAGWALDRFAPLVIVALFLGFISAGAFSLFWVRPGVTAWVYGALLGLGGGISRSAGGVVWPYYFGVKYLGAIQGRVFMFVVLAAAAAPLPFAFVFERYGSYSPIVVPLAILPLLLITWVLSLRGQGRPVLVNE